MQNKIDFVVLWVDGGDEVWKEKKAKYLPKTKGDTSVARYRDWDTLCYWFRSVEKNAPWVNRIHLVTDEQIPPWMNTEHPKLHLVSHKDYIPKSCLPLFNSSAIEIGIGNIPDLAQKFVYFNDDVFLNQPISPEYYFENGIPVDMAGLTRRGEVRSTFQHIMQNDDEIINRHFRKREVLQKHFLKWYRPSYGKTFLRTLLVGWGKEFHGFVIPHMSVPYRMLDITRVWEAERAVLEETQTHRFRYDTDLNHYVYRFWRLCIGDFVPRKNKGKYISLCDMRSIDRFEKLLNSKSCPEFCINDNWRENDFETAKKRLLRAFEKRYPEKSSFEK